MITELVIVGLIVYVLGIIILALIALMSRWDDIDKTVFTIVFWPLIAFIKMIKNAPKFPGFLLSGAKKTLKDL